jgi:hypothetical protein
MWQVPIETSENYINFVKQCLTDDALFSNFKSNPHYNSIVGMSAPWQSPHFYMGIKQNPVVMDKFKDLIKNDIYGGTPNMGQVDSYFVSPNTLRHIYTVCDIIKHFGNLDNKKISELGVGYGATAYMVKTMSPTTDYYLIDLPEVKEFATKYLNHFDLEVNSSEPPDAVDIFISEFCLSEFDDKTINEFYTKYIQNADGVYLMMNLHDEVRKQNFIQMMNYDFNLEILPEYPVTHWPNYIIVGKK